MLLSLEAIGNRGLQTFAVVLNGLDTSDSQPTGMDNLADLDALSCPVHQTAHDEPPAADHPLIRALADCAEAG